MHIEMYDDEGEDAPWWSRVLVATIRRAIVDWKIYSNHPREELNALGKDAEAWLFSDKEGHMQFATICSQLKIDKDYIRKLANKMTKEEAMTKTARVFDYD